MTTVNKGNQEE